MTATTRNKVTARGHRQQFWQDHLNRCTASGQTLRAYAAEHGLKISTLYFYRKKFRSAQSPTDSSGHKPVFVRASVASPAHPCRVHLRNGVTVEIGVSDDRLAPLLLALNGLS